MLTRRSLLIGLSGIVAANLLTSCQNKHNGLRVSLLRSSIPAQLLTKFRQGVDQDRLINFQLETSLDNLWELLVNQEASLVTLGDTWLEKAIRENLVQPLSKEELSNWQQLPSNYQQLVTRDRLGYPNPNGQIWGAPYRWGTMMIAYRSDYLSKLGITPNDWGDLWREELRDRFSLPNDPREVIGLTLKKLGYSYNQENLTAIPQLKPELERLHQQVKFYSSDSYLQPLIMGDTWLAVGWSTDIIPLAKNYSRIEAVIPSSGTSLWVDVWVKATQENHQDTNIIKQWLDFCWQPQAVEAITRLTDAASPMILNNPIAAEIDKPLVVVDENILERSEFLLPLSAATLEEYRHLWEAVVLG
ncbi:MAG: extracellular solute-binding protein [Gloeocapsa sp. DLM2.Bin57]|nr:MAG: extracellular solute-binding protein [Gloeocapsa sp. DLM2.Bin57]